MARAISNKNLCDAIFQVADFDGKWLDSFGKPELRGAWIIYGESGSGKTHFALELLNYLTGFVQRSAYDTIEQGKSLSFQNAWNNAAGRLRESKDLSPCLTPVSLRPPAPMSQGTCPPVSLRPPAP